MARDVNPLGEVFPIKHSADSPSLGPGDFTFDGHLITPEIRASIEDPRGFDGRIVDCFGAMCAGASEGRIETVSIFWWCREEARINVRNPDLVRKIIVPWVATRTGGSWKVGGLRLTQDDFDSLASGRWTSPMVVEAYLRALCSAPHGHYRVLSHAWWGWVEAGVMTAATRQAEEDWRGRHSEEEKLVASVLVGERSGLVTLAPAEGRIEYYSSGPHRREMEAIGRLLEFSAGMWPGKDWRWENSVAPEHVPMHHRESDDGVFVCGFARAIITDELTDFEDVEGLREEVAGLLVFAGVEEVNT